MRSPTLGYTRQHPSPELSSNSFPCGKSWGRVLTGARAETRPREVCLSELTGTSKRTPVGKCCLLTWSQQAFVPPTTVNAFRGRNLDVGL